MKFKILTFVLLIVLLMYGCATIHPPTAPTEKPGIPQATENVTIEETSVIPDFNSKSIISKIEYLDRDISWSINNDWLINELSNCYETDSPKEAIALEMDINITFNNGTTITLNLLNPIESVFSIKVNDSIYTLKSENISIWLDYLSDSGNNPYSGRGIVGEINTEDNNFMLINFVDNSEMALVTLLDNCNKSISDIHKGDKVIVLFTGGSTASDPALSSTAHIIVDNYPQKRDPVKNSDTIADMVEIISNDGQYSKENESQSNIIVMVSNQSFEKPKIDLKGYMGNLIVFAEEFECETQHECSFYYLKTEEGTYPLKVAGNGFSSSTVIPINDDEKTWIYFTYWNNDSENEKIVFTSQHEPIGID